MDAVAFVEQIVGCSLTPPQKELLRSRLKGRLQTKEGYVTPRGAFRKCKNQHVGRYQHVLAVFLRAEILRRKP